MGKVLREPPYRNPKYYINFWGFLFTSIIFICSVTQMVEGIYFIELNRKNMAYILTFRSIQMVAWAIFFLVQIAEISRFLPHSGLVFNL